MQISISIRALLCASILQFSFLSYADFPVEEGYDGTALDLRGMLFKVQERTLPATVQSLNVISGKPLFSVEDSTGGFGDVAANFVAALNFKKRNPHLTVNFLVTSQNPDPETTAMRSDKIVSIMAPELSPNKLNQAQDYQGVNVYFVSTPIEEMRVKVPEEVVRQLPKADLTIQFAANHIGVAALGQALSPVSFDFMEFGTLDHQLSWASSPEDVAEFGKRIEKNGNLRPSRLTFNTGANFAGVYVSKFDAEENSVRQQEVQNWLQSHHSKSLSLNESSLAFGYSKDAPSSALYLSAIKILAKKNPAKNYVVVLKGDPAQSESLPKNVALIKTNTFSNRMMENLIILSDLPPLVTGDTSVSLAISSLRKDRFFLYDQPPWKRTFVDKLVESLVAEDLGKLSPEEGLQIDKMLRINLKAIENHPRLAEDVAHFFENLPLQKKASATLNQSLPKIDLYKNVFLIYQLYYFFELEMRSGYSDFAKILTAQLMRSGSWPQFKKDLVQIFTDQNVALKKRAFAAMALSKWGYFRENPSDFFSLINELHATAAKGRYPMYNAVLAFGHINEKDFGSLLLNSVAKNDYIKFKNDHKPNDPQGWYRQWNNSKYGILPYSPKNPRPKRIQGSSSAELCKKVYKP